MENGFESWFQNQKIDWQSTNPNALSAPKEQYPVQKNFLVFDQSNDRTTLIYSSTPIPIPIPFHFPNLQSTIDRGKVNSRIRKHEDVQFRFRGSNTFLDERNDSRSEMREDTEELNALLYSDDDEIGDSEDEEEQSTGHSPIPGLTEEVASSTGRRKRHKLENGGHDVLSLEDTASSGKSGINCSGEAELSSCGDNGGAAASNGLPEVEFPGKRSRKEKLRETISILGNLIPGGKNGKDAMMIIDEAISYLRILKVKAKALGLDSP